MIPIVCLLWCGADLQAAAWTQPKGDHYTKVWIRGLFGRNVFDAEGDSARLGGPYQDVNVQAYGELGLTDRLTAVAALTPVGVASHGGETRLYMGNSMVGLRAGAPIGALRLAGELRLGGNPDVGAAPLAGIGVGESGAVVYQPAVAGARGELEAQLGGPLSFGWWVIAPGVRLQTADVLPVSATAHAQLGWSVSEAWTVDLHINVLEPISPRQEPGIVNAAGTGWTRYQGYGAAASWWMKPALGLHFGIEGVVTAMSNAETPTLVLGLEHRSR